VNTFHRRRPTRRPHGAPSTLARPIATPERPARAPAAPLTPDEAAAIESSPFTRTGLSQALVRALFDEGYATPTPVQTEVIPHVLAGRDVLACAQTGTGKTAAFVLPLLQRLVLAPRTGGIRVLVVTPTRELASQIGERVDAYGRHLGVRHTVVFGGVSQHGQEAAIRRGPDVLIATPGRLLDLMQQKIVKLDGVAYLVLDEADRMLDMGFIRDVRTICAALPSQRQTLLFSATMPPDLLGIARALLRDPVQVAITPVATTAVTVEQSVVFVAKADKRALLERILRDVEVRRAIVFTSTKRGANRLADQLAQSGIESQAIHGNKSQSARERALEAFRAGRSQVLIATDVASRGIDVDGVSHVINFELPNTPEGYVHRIGRTGRAGATGTAITLCDPGERGLLTQIERLIRRRLPVVGMPSGSPSTRPAPMGSPVVAMTPGSPSPRQAPIGIAPAGPPRQAPVTRSTRLRPFV
jgi:ATP-dependent RNA helicase RhlE